MKQAIELEKPQSEGRRCCDGGRQHGTGAKRLPVKSRAVVDFGHAWKLYAQSRKDLEDPC